jgi:hypothetical protein
MMAGFSGLGGTAKEAFSLASSLTQGLQSTSPLIREVSAREEVMAGQEGIRKKAGTLDGQNFKQQLNTMAINEAKQAVAAIEQKSPGDAAPYKEWLVEIANKVANAAKEGGFLGFGGERVSEGERQTLSQLSEALGLPIQAQNATA